MSQWGERARDLRVAGVSVATLAAPAMAHADDFELVSEAQAAVERVQGSPDAAKAIKAFVDVRTRRLLDEHQQLAERHQHLAQRLSHTRGDRLVEARRWITFAEKWGLPEQQKKSELFLYEQFQPQLKTRSAALRAKYPDLVPRSLSTLDDFVGVGGSEDRLILGSVLFDAMPAGARPPYVLRMDWAFQNPVDGEGARAGGAEPGELVSDER